MARRPTADTPYLLELILLIFNGLTASLTGRCKPVASQTVPRLELLCRLNALVDQGESGGTSTAKFGLEPEKDNERLENEKDEKKRRGNVRDGYCI